MSAGIVIEEGRIRQLLIDSCHSSAHAQEFFRSNHDDVDLLNCLVRIAVDEDDYGGDAPMEAAHYLSEFPSHLLKSYEKELAAALPRVNGYGGAIALALGKTRSQTGKALILRELGDGERFDAWLFRKALAYYDVEDQANME